MEETPKQGPESQDASRLDMQSLVQQAIQEYVRQDQSRREPAYKAELQDERKRREQMEQRLNELVEENKRSRQLAEEAERNAVIRSELQRLGVAKVELAHKVVQGDVFRTEDGRLAARTEHGEVGLKDYLSAFVSDNPEFLPARISGGSGMAATQKGSVPTAGSIDLDRIKPGMTREEMDRVRQEIVRVASQTGRNV